MQIVKEVRRWLGAPQVYEVAALVAAALLCVLEVLTPWEITYVAIGDDAFLIESSARPTWGLVGSVLLVLSPVVALRSLWLGVLLVLPRLIIGAAIGFAWPWTTYAALVAVAVCGSWRTPRGAWLVAMGALVVPLMAIASKGRLMTPGGSVEFGLQGEGAWGLFVTALLYVGATGLVMLLPLLMRREAARERDLLDLIRGRKQVARDAVVLGERARLARDLHDVVAHHVSLIAVRAETAPFTYPDLPDDARAVLAEIAEESRLALGELRGVLDVLRRTDEPTKRTPQPTAQDITRLVQDAERSPGTVEASLRNLEAVAPTTGYVAYRVAQEALTNARRHAPDASISITAHGDTDGGITVRVANPTTEEARLFEHGQGLTGMAERVAAIGGALDIAVRDDQFVVAARLPGPGTGSSTADGTHQEGPE
jgi:signal transduction histidine kinase